MSRNYDIYYGYGVCFDDYDEVCLEKLLELIKESPKLHERIQTYINENHEGEVTDTSVILEDFVEKSGHVNFGGIAAIMCEVILENEGIELCVVEDCYGKEFLLYMPSYPWTLATLSKKEQALTIESLNDIFEKYIRMITDNPIRIDYQEAETGY